MTLGESAKKAREKAGLTRQQLSDKTGYHRETIAEIERGGKEPRIYTVVDLADALGVSVDEYIGHKTKKVRK